MKKTIIGIMGSAHLISKNKTKEIQELGAFIAKKGWILLNGGKNSGVMHYSAKGAKKENGLTIGILPFEDNQTNSVSEYIDIPIYTGMGNARNIINILSSDILIICEGKEGTLSEAAISLKMKKPTIFFGFKYTNLPNICTQKNTFVCNSPLETIGIIEKILNKNTT